MLDEQDMPSVTERVKELLIEAETQNIYLEIMSSVFDSGWIYLTVAPSRVGGNASQHASFMIKVERTLKSEGYYNVMLFPYV